MRLKGQIIRNSNRTSNTRHSDPFIGISDFSNVYIVYIFGFIHLLTYYGVNLFLLHWLRVGFINVYGVNFLVMFVSIVYAKYYFPHFWHKDLSSWGGLFWRKSHWKHYPKTLSISSISLVQTFLWNEMCYGLYILRCTAIEHVR